MNIKKILAFSIVFAVVLSFAAVLTPASYADNEEAVLGLGRIEDNVYINENVGIAFSFDDSWVIYPAEQLQQLPEISREIFEGSELEEIISTSGQITDILAENEDELLTMNVLFTEIPSGEKFFFLLSSEEEIIDATLENADAIIASYEHAGIMVDSIGKVEAEFLGEPRFAIHTKAAINDVPYYILQFFDYGFGDYYVTVTLASFVEDNTIELADQWYKP